MPSPAETQARLRIVLFGDVQILCGGAEPYPRLTHVTQSLLAYLILNRQRPHPRSMLADLFWGEQRESRAHNCLSTALWRLRHALEPDGVPRGTYLTTTLNGEIAFNTHSDFWLDVATFEQVSRQVLSLPVHEMRPSDAQALANAMQLYRGELLEGFDFDWAVRERERLRCLYLSDLAHQLQYCRANQAFDQGLRCGQLILNLDPLREEIHREMMQLYVLNGQRALAIQHYLRCEEILLRELGIAPMEETQHLYAEIMSSGSLHIAWAPEQPANDHGAIQQALRALSAGAQALHEAQEQMQRAILSLSQFDGPRE